MRLKSARQALFGFSPVLLAVFAIVAYGHDSKYNIFIPFVATPEHVVERMLELAETGPDDLVLDLGSGDGRIPILAARKFGARARGVDIDPALVMKSEENAARAGVADRVEFRREDLFVTDISDATVVTLYVLTQVNLKLRPRLLAELRPGTRVISHDFSMGEWIADRLEDFRGVSLYLWVIPADVAGEWEVRDGAQNFTLSLDQHFQELKGKAQMNGRALPVREARLRGSEIEFSVEFDAGAPTIFRGKVDGDRIEARPGTGVQARDWSATRTVRAAADRGD